MTKPFAFGVLAFLLGVGATVMAVANPGQWSWMDHVRAALVRTPPPQPARRRRRSARKVKYWRAPMDPTYIRDKPGKSPMGMDLVPVYEDEAGLRPARSLSIRPSCRTWAFDPSRCGGRTSRSSSALWAR